MPNKKMTFEEKYQSLSIRYGITFDDEYLDTLRKAHDLKVDISPFFSSSYQTWDQVMNSINTQLRHTYTTRIHNIGDDALNRYYKVDKLVPDWLKLLHYIIAHFKFKDIDSRIMSNNYLAEKLGWISSNEMDPEVIRKASRKVTEALNILKTEVNCFSVEHRHRASESGSYHIIKANWIEIISLFSSYNEKDDMSVRQRKGIKYRILSFILKTSKSIPDKLVHLMDRQRYKYLYDQQLITYDLDSLRRSRSWWSTILFYYKQKFKQSAMLQHYGPKDIVPEYQHPNMTLKIKSYSLFAEIKKILDELANMMKQDFNINLNVVNS